MLQAVSSLHGGVTADAHGWNTECLRQLIGHLSTAWVGEQLQHLQTLSTDHIAWRMVSIYKIVALKKNTAGAVPIAMPTVWHKLAAHIQVQESGAVIRSLTEPYQYALGASNPAHAMSEAMAARICELEDPVVVQLDIANAYGSLKRHYIDKALRDCGPRLGLQEMQRWNANLHYGQTSVGPGATTLLAALIGVPQGDPAVRTCSSLDYIMYSRNGAQPSLQQHQSWHTLTT